MPRLRPRFLASFVGLAALVAAASAGGHVPDLGPNASLHGKRVFAPDDPWNRAIDKEPIDPDSAKLIASIGEAKPLHPDFGAAWNGGPFGIPYVLVSSKQPRVAVRFTDYPDESDPGPYPIPPDAPIEGGAASDGDRHVLVLDRDAWKLYELWHGAPDGKGWKAANGAVFDLASGKPRPLGWTSADAAGLPIFPGLVRYDEVVEQKAILHAVRFTCRRSRRAFVPPARHHAGAASDAALPPMGMRVRLKASFDVSKLPEAARVIATCLKTYGMILADNGGDWFVSGAPDARWNDGELGALKQLKGSDFEVVKMVGLVAR